MPFPEDFHLPRQVGIYDGVLQIDKPSGPTSHDIVAMIRRQFRFDKVGHGGTLDPQAPGLPVILVVGLRLGCLNHALLTAHAVRARGPVCRTHSIVSATAASS